jgi:hypothetical protein
MTLQLVEVDDPAQVVDDIADLTPGWLSAVLTAATGTPVGVRDVRAKAIGTGQTGVSYRIELDHDRPGAVPASLVVKLAAGPPQSRMLVGQGYAWETGFYQHLADRVRVRTPRVWHAAITPDHLRFTLILQDLSPAVPGRQADGCSPAAARAALENLAGLHAPLWNAPLLREGLAWLGPPDADFVALISALSKDATGTFVARYRDRLRPGDAEVLTAAAELTETWMTRHQTPFAVVHGDYRLDNLMFTSPLEGAGGEDGPGVFALDWQTVGIGHPLRDVAYFLSMSLPPAVRREHEDELLAAYHRALVAQGVPGFSLPDCRAGYRIGMLQGPLITILGCVYSPSSATAEADAMFLSMITRAVQAVRDLGTLEAVTR